MDINFEALVQALQKEEIVDDNPKVYIVWWTNGEPYDEIRRILKVFSTQEKAEAYIKKWGEDYKNECDKMNAEEQEEVWMYIYDLQ